MHKKTPKKAACAVIFAEVGSPELRPLTDHLPTGLVPVGGTPILDRQIQALLRLGIEDIVVIGGYRAAQVEQACRFYDTVQFRYNPQFSRIEPHTSALMAAGSLEEKALLLIRGDLVFGDAALRELCAKDRDAVMVNGKGKAVGLCRLTAKQAREVGTAADAAVGRGEGERSLFAFLEAHTNKSLELSADEFDCTRIATMEDLARALKANQRSTASVQKPEEAISEPSKMVPEVSAQAGLEAGQVPVSELPEEDLDPVDGKGRTRLSRPLLKVLHR